MKKKDTKLKEIPFIGYGDIQQQQKFLQPISDYSQKNNQIFPYIATTLSGNSTIYTVPKGKVFFIYSILLTQYNSSAVSYCAPAVYFGIESTLITVAVAPSGAGSTQRDYSIPVRIDENEQIKINSSAGYCFCSIIGWLEDKKQGAN